MATDTEMLDWLETHSETGWTRMYDENVCAWRVHSIRPGQVANWPIFFTSIRIAIADVMEKEKVLADAMRREEESDE